MAKSYSGARTRTSHNRSVLGGSIGPIVMSPTPMRVIQEFTAKEEFGMRELEFPGEGVYIACSLVRGSIIGSRYERRPSSEPPMPRPRGPRIRD